MTNDFDVEYIKKIWEQAKSFPELQGYTMAYVTTIQKYDQIVSAIKKYCPTRKFSEGYKTEGDVIRATPLRHNGEKYTFIFIRNCDADGFNPTDALNEIALSNSAVKQNIAWGEQAPKFSRTRPSPLKKLKPSPLNMQLAESVAFVDQKGELHDLMEIPICMLDVKDGEINQTTFLTAFKTAKDNCARSCDLKRKYVLDENGQQKQLIYAVISPQLFLSWKEKRDQISGVGTYVENIEILKNNIRLDLDQCQNACTEYYLVEPNFEKGETVSKENRAYITKRNTQSICLIGNSYFDKSLFDVHYHKTLGNRIVGNVYHIENIMFLPQKTELDKTSEYIEKVSKNINILTPEEKELARQRALNSDSQQIENIINKSKDKQKFEETKLFQYNLKKEEDAILQTKETEANKKILKYLKEKYPEVSELFVSPAEKTKTNRFQTKAEEKYIPDHSSAVMLYKNYHENLVKLRERFDYVDPQSKQKFAMQNVYGLGYKTEEKQLLEKVYGKTGVDIYNRYYALKLVNYMLDHYKASAAVYDLTNLSVMFKYTEAELRELEKPSGRVSEKTMLDAKHLVKQIYEDASIDKYIATTQRFNSILDIKVLKREEIKEGKNKSETKNEKNYIYMELYNDTYFNAPIRKIIEHAIGKQITPLKMVENSNKISELMFTKERQIWVEQTNSEITEELKQKLDESEKNMKNNENKPRQ